MGCNQSKSGAVDTSSMHLEEATTRSQVKRHRNTMVDRVGSKPSHPSFLRVLFHVYSLTPTLFDIHPCLLSRLLPGLLSHANSDVYSLTFTFSVPFTFSVLLSNQLSRLLSLHDFHFYSHVCSLTSALSRQLSHVYSQVHSLISILSSILSRLLSDMLSRLLSCLVPHV